jgi:hypothetical protein
MYGSRDEYFFLISPRLPALYITPIVSSPDTPPEKKKGEGGGSGDTGQILGLSSHGKSHMRQIHHGYSMVLTARYSCSS